MQFCREKQPFNVEVSKKLKHIKEALEHEEQERNARSKISGAKLKTKLEEHKNKGNEYFKNNKLGKFL